MSVRKKIYKNENEERDVPLRMLNWDWEDNDL